MATSMICWSETIRTVFIRVALVVVLVCELMRPAAAIPPPPEDPSYKRSFQAINSLRPFLGEWEGSYSQQDLSGGTFRITETRTLKQIGAAISMSSYESNGQESLFSAITANAKGELSFHRIGIGWFKRGEIETVAIKRLTPTKIQWTLSGLDFRKPGSRQSSPPSSVRVTVSIIHGEWHELREYLKDHPSSSSITLHKKH